MFFSERFIIQCVQRKLNFESHRGPQLTWQTSLKNVHMFVQTSGRLNKNSEASAITTVLRISRIRFDSQTLKSRVCHSKINKINRNMKDMLKGSEGK